MFSYVKTIAVFELQFGTKNTFIISVKDATEAVENVIFGGC